MTVAERIIEPEELAEEDLSNATLDRVVLLLLQAEEGGKA